MNTYKNLNLVIVNPDKELLESMNDESLLNLKSTYSEITKRIDTEMEKKKLDGKNN